MNDPLLVFGEAAYLLIVARRGLNYRRDAEARNEEYHDLMPMTRLQCGAKAKLKFLSGPSGYTPVVDIQWPNPFEDGDVARLADEIAATSMQLSYCDPKTSYYTFTRKIE